MAIEKRRVRGGFHYIVRLGHGRDRVTVGTFDNWKDAREANKQTAPKQRRIVSEYVRWWLEHRQRHGIRPAQRVWNPRTAKTNSYAVKPFVQRFGKRALDSLSKAEAQDWASSVSPGYVSVIGALYNDALFRDEVRANPLEGLGRRVSSDDLAPTPEELQALLNACSVHENYGPIFAATIVFSAYVGLRVGEIAGINRADVNPAKSQVHVQRQWSGWEPKYESSGVVYLPPPALEAFYAIPDLGTPHLFYTKTGERFTKGTLNWTWTQVRARAGLTTKLKSLRDFGAMELARRGVDRRWIARQLRHSDEGGVADRYYVTTGTEDALPFLQAAYQENVTKLREVK